MSNISQWLATQNPAPANPLGDFNVMSSYGQPAVTPTPDLFSGKTGFDWGGASNVAPKDWSQGFGFQGQGGFDGSSMPNGGMFGGDFWKSMIGGKDKEGMGSNGWGGLALGAANTFMNMQNYGLAKDSFNHNKALSINNFNNQATLTQDHLNKLNERDRREAQLNGRAAPGAAVTLTRM